MTQENISTLFSIEGLSLLGTFLVGFNNNELWLNSAFYILLPLFVIVLTVSFFSLLSKKTLHYRRKVTVFFWFNLIMVIILATFVWWALGGIGL
jgi:FtsH-binding integral membrane protein